MMFGKDVKAINDPYGKERSVWDDVITFKG